MIEKKELDKHLKSSFLDKLNKRLGKVKPENQKKNLFDKQTKTTENKFDKQIKEIIERVEKDNLIENLKEIFEWYAPHADVSFSYLSGIVPKWGYPGSRFRELSLKIAPGEEEKRQFKFVVVLNKRWLRSLFRKQRWILICLDYSSYRNLIEYKMYSSDRCMDERWLPGDDKNTPIIDFPNHNNTFDDMPSLLEFIKQRLMHKMTSPSLKKIDYWDTYPFDRKGLS